MLRCWPHANAWTYGGGGRPLWETAWLGDLPVAVLKPAGRFYIAPDHLGAPHQITDASGAVVWQWHPDPFGNGDPLGAFTYELRFPGQFYDQGTKLHYNYFRDYDPRTGRYIESDPVGLAGGINTYAYAEGNPLARTDPEGTQIAIPVPGPWVVPCLANPYCAGAMAAAAVGAYICESRRFSGPGGGGKDVDCGEVLKQCRAKCLDTFVNNPGGLPGTGRDYFGWMRRCTRECVEANGCHDF